MEKDLQNSNEKKIKKPKMVRAKKLPGILKKAYTEKQLEKKLLRKIEIPQDREMVKNLFHFDENKKRYIVSKTLELTKPDFDRLKKIGKDVKKQKFGIKFVPLVAFVGTISAIVIVIAIFKNPLLKKGITAGMEKVFHAKCDIGYLDLNIFGAKLQIKNLAQANKNEPMKNIFEVGEITFDFNLTELLKGKFYAENMTVADVLIGTDRKTSGAIPYVETAEEKKTNSQLAKLQKELTSDVKKSLEDTFADYNPQNIIKNVQANLKSPELARKTKSQVEEKIAKWKDAPTKMQNDVMSLKTSIEDITKTDWANVHDVATLNNALTTINSAITKANALKNDTKEMTARFKNDMVETKQVMLDIQAALKNDKNLIDVEINKFKDLKAGGISGIFEKLVTAFMYNLLGKYYPYVQAGLNKAMELKSKMPAKKKEAKKKTNAFTRAKGRNVYYKRDTVPKFLLEKAFGSGANWKFLAKEISSDADKRGKPATLAASFDVKKISSAIDATIDARTETKNPLLAVQYTGKGFPIALNIEDNFLLDSANSTISCGIDGNDIGNFHLNGSVLMTQMKIATPAFEPEAVYTIYQKALDNFTTMKVGFVVGYDSENGIVLSLKTDAAKQFANVFQKMLSSELKNATNIAREKIEALLSEQTGGISDKVTELIDIENLFLQNEKDANNTNAMLENAKKKIKSQLANQAEEKAVEKASSLIKGLFGR